MSDAISDFPTRAVVLAGGMGTRLAPYTVSFPKPLMPVGDMPILELLIRQLARSGVQRVTLAVGHLASLIMAFFGDGERLGVQVDYSLEKDALGTAGPLRLIDDLTEPFYVLNGDLLTDLDVRSLAVTHYREQAAATVGVYRRTIEVNLGVLEVDGSGHVSHYVEKPVMEYLASMGAYVMHPLAIARIPAGTRFDIPDLIGALLESGDSVASHIHDGYWLDIGRPDDYAKAQQDATTIIAKMIG